jgi:hypothetical protein
MHSYEQPGPAFDEVGGRIYAALRSGDLDAGPVLELACLLEEWGRRTVAVQEVLERPTADLTVADLTRLGERLLDDIGFEPTFALEPGLWATLEQALGIVERDVRAAGIAGTLRLVTPGWDHSGQAWVEFQGGHHGNGIRPVAGRGLQGALANVADAAQETIMELIWTVWPTCPMHHLGLHADLERGTAVWRCAGGGAHTVAPVGTLPAQHR